MGAGLVWRTHCRKIELHTKLCLVLLPYNLFSWHGFFFGIDFSFFLSFWSLYVLMCGSPSAVMLACGCCALLSLLSCHIDAIPQPLIDELIPHMSEQHCHTGRSVNRPGIDVVCGSGPCLDDEGRQMATRQLTFAVRGPQVHMRVRCLSVRSCLGCLRTGCRP